MTTSTPKSRGFRLKRDAQTRDTNDAISQYATKQYFRADFRSDQIAKIINLFYLHAEDWGMIIFKTISLFNSRH